MATPSLLSRVIESQGQDAEISSISDQIQLGMGYKGWAFHTDGSLWYKGWVVVPQLTALREKILKEFPCSCFSMHPGGMKMYHDLRSQYYRSVMKRHVRDFVRWCLTCQQVKSEHQKATGLFQPLEVVEWKWENVTMDLVTHLPRTPRRHDAVWVIVDWLTKSIHFLAMWMTFTLEELCRLYIRGIIRVHGVPVSIVLDKDPKLWHTFGRVSRRL